MNLILLFNGFVMLAVAGTMGIVASLYPATRGDFVLAALVVLATGGMLAIVGQSRERTRLLRRHIFLLTSTAWVSAALAGALPFYFWGMSVTDAVFESMSGITTTGSTVLSGLDEMTHGILLWRAMLQWFGGVGIIVTAMAVLPILKVSGMQLFRTESSESGERELRSAASFAAATVWIYVVLTQACAIAYILGGMNVFEAITHAMTTLSTGGFSTSDASMGHFQSPSIQWSATLFMALGGMPFVWYIRAINKRVFSNEQVAAYLPFLLVTITLLTIWRLKTADVAVGSALREVAFSVASVVTTTGYAATDYTTWGAFGVATFFFLTTVGGCSGSTAGGVKIMRWVVAIKAIGASVRAIQYPSGIFHPRYDGRVLEAGVIDGVVAFFSIFFLSVAVVAGLLNMTGLDLLTSISGSLTALMNVGPGVGDIIGPAGNFSTLPGVAKWVLVAAMFLGRLEIITVLVLLSPGIWRD